MVCGGKKKKNDKKKEQKSRKAKIKNKTGLLAILGQKKKTDFEGIEKQQEIKTRKKKTTKPPQAFIKLCKEDT